MLVAFDANNVFRNSGEMGDWARTLVERMASRKGANFRALLFATRMKADYKSVYTSFANVSTFVPTGKANLMPSTWMRFSLGPYLKDERVRVFHGLNEELPYGVADKVKTVVTCFGLDEHYTTSIMDKLLWKRRMKYALKKANIVVAVSEKVKADLLSAGVPAEKVRVIGTDNPYEVTEEMVEQYMEIYRSLVE